MSSAFDKGAAMITRDFYMRDVNAVAPELLGKLLVHETPEGIASGLIVEVESYAGPHDKGAHSYGNRQTERTKIQYGAGGFAYIFTIYGMYDCFNVVVNMPTKPEAILVRALEPVDGIELMKRRRKTENLISLCNGPGKLCGALGITKEQYGYDLCGSSLFIKPYEDVPEEQIMVSPRINIDYAEECKDYLWRYFIKENPHVSKVAKKYREKYMSYEMLKLKAQN